MAAIFEQELESAHELELEGLGELEQEMELAGETEFETEAEFEAEMESEISPIRKIYADAMMEHLAHSAAESETEQEAAEHFLPLIGMAASKLLPVVAKAVAPALKRAVPRLAQAVTRVQPQLTRGITRIARTLHRQPSTRRLLHTVPTIARRTVHSIATQAAHGHPVTARSAIRTLSNQTRRVLSSRPLRLQALRRSRILDRHFHRHLGPHTVRPHYWRGGSYGGYAAYPAPGAAYRPAAPFPSAPPPPPPRVAPPTFVSGTVAPGYAPYWTGAPGSAGGWCPRCGGQPSAAYCSCCGQPLR